MIRKTWGDFDAAVLLLCQSVEMLPIHSIYPMPRGGLALALAMSHHLDAPIASAPPTYGQMPGQLCLWVDDIIDSGQTIKRAVAALRAQRATRGPAEPPGPGGPNSPVRPTNAPERAWARQGPLPSDRHPGDVIYAAWVCRAPVYGRLASIVPLVAAEVVTHNDWVVFPWEDALNAELEQALYCQARSAK